MKGLPDNLLRKEVIIDCVNLSNGIRMTQATPELLVRH